MYESTTSGSKQVVVNGCTTCEYIPSCKYNGLELAEPEIFNVSLYYTILAAKNVKYHKNHIKYIDDAWNYMFPENLSFLAWKMTIFKILLYDPWVQIKVLHFLLSQTTEGFNQLDNDFQMDF